MSLKDDPGDDVALWVELVGNEKRRDEDDGKDEVPFVVEFMKTEMSALVLVCEIGIPMAFTLCVGEIR